MGPDDNQPEAIMRLWRRMYAARFEPEGKLRTSADDIDALKYSDRFARHTELTLDTQQLICSAFHL